MRRVYKDEFRTTVKNPSVGKNTGRNSNVLAFRALRDRKHNRLKNEIQISHIEVSTNRVQSGPVKAVHEVLQPQQTSCDVT